MVHCVMSYILSKFDVIWSAQLWELDQTKLYIENLTRKLVVQIRSNIAQIWNTGALSVRGVRSSIEP